MAVAFLATFVLATLECVAADLFTSPTAIVAITLDRFIATDTCLLALFVARWTLAGLMTWFIAHMGATREFLLALK